MPALRDWDLIVTFDHFVRHVVLTHTLKLSFTGVLIAALKTAAPPKNNIKGGGQECPPYTCWVGYFRLTDSFSGRTCEEPPTITV